MGGAHSSFLCSLSVENGGVVVKERGKNVALQRDVIVRCVEELGFEFVDLEWAVENDKRVLRVLIDSIGGITIKDCEIVSRRINNLLDEMDFSTEKYFFEVSSPGVERPLIKYSDFLRFLGKKVLVRISKGKGKRRDVVGRLASVSELAVTLVLEDASEETIPFDTITRAHLVFELEEGGQKQKKKKSGKEKNYAVRS